MNQITLWNDKWAGVRKTSKPSRFAKKCYNTIKKKNYKTLLELGWGDGKDSLYFNSKRFKVMSVDFSKKGIEHLKKQIQKNNLKNIEIQVRDMRN